MVNIDATVTKDGQYVKHFCLTEALLDFLSRGQPECYQVRYLDAGQRLALRGDVFLRRYALRGEIHRWSVNAGLYGRRQGVAIMDDRGHMVVTVAAGRQRAVEICALHNQVLPLARQYWAEICAAQMAFDPPLSEAGRLVAAISALQAERDQLAARVRELESRC